MKIDLYTKVVLTIIALALVGILLRPILTPSTASAAGDGKFAHIQNSIGFDAIAFFDEKKGDVYLYSQRNGSLGGRFNWKLIELGKPLQEIK